MGEENKVRDAADAVRGALEAVPVYQDALRPAAKQVGTALETLGKAINAALSPLRGLVWGLDRISVYVEEVLQEKLKHVPAERIRTPSPSVAVPTLEALRYTAHEPSLRELYANLLATSMDEQTARYAHPAFVEAIRQMTPDEARIVEFLANHQTFPMITVGVGFPMLNPADVHAERLLHFTSIANDSGCSYPDLWPTYLNNLSRLGLVEIKEGAVMGSDAIYKTLQNHPIVREVISEIEEVQLGFATSRNEFLQLTELGNQFCKSCIARDS